MYVAAIQTYVQSGVRHLCLFILQCCLLIPASVHNKYALKLSRRHARCCAVIRCAVLGWTWESRGSRLTCAIRAYMEKVSGCVGLVLRGLKLVRGCCCPLQTCFKWISAGFLSMRGLAPEERSLSLCNQNTSLSSLTLRNFLRGPQGAPQLGGTKKRPSGEQTTIKLDVF